MILRNYKLTIIFFILSICVFGNLHSQMQKVFCGDSVVFYGNCVSLSGDYAVSQGTTSYEHTISALDLYYRNKNKWTLKKKFKEKSLANSFIWGSWGSAVSNNKLFILRNSPFFYAIFDLLIYDISSEQKDSIISRKNETIENFGYDGSWLVVRKSRLDNEAGILTHYNVDLFYKFDGNKPVLYDSIKVKHDNVIDKPNISRISVSDHYVAIGFYRDSFYGYYDGSVTVYKRDGDKWSFFQTLINPLVGESHKSHFGVGTAISEDGRFLVIGNILANDQKGKVFIYELHGDKYELFQTINEPAEKSYAQFGNSISLNDNNLLIGQCEAENKYFRGKVYNYVFIDNQWKLKATIQPPESDKKYSGFGCSLEQSGEWVIVGAQIDITYPKSRGAAYIFRIPARDTVSMSVCSGEGYIFGNKTYYETGIYYDTLVASYGVDSIVVLNLSVYGKQSHKIDTTLCAGQSVVVGGQSYKDIGVYNIKLKDRNGCDSIITLSLNISDQDTSAQIYPDYGCKCGEIELNVTGNSPPYAYKWENGSSFNKISNLEAGLYGVEVKDKAGCISNYEFEVKNEIPYMIPNALLPQTTEEEVSKKFWIYISGRDKDQTKVKIISTSIFDRWGEKVFESSGDLFWDGTFNSKPLPPGAYLYRVTIESPCGTEVKKGTVTLIR